ncbi:PREDICTED: complement component C7 [Gekko japonicus]|uniref:Complement component C7 n=1 Tax=Gekko japonicus TaxID=146911 RepID=A0ABM1JTM7_GEKJA|nr:PREDICTED: complement component C7 [Gekko japonicus]
MKALEMFILAEIVGSFRAFARPAAIHCNWNPYGPWSECDGCNKTQIRRRTIATFGQFGGYPCSGESFESRTCTPTRGCPTEDGCGDRFRCASGLCISRSLVCNGDYDCEEDRSDEDRCEVTKVVCDTNKLPPNVELTGAGFDALTGKTKGRVIHTKSFGGQCRKVFNVDQRDYYRQSVSVLSYTFQVQIQNDFHTEFYDSSWSYMKHNVNQGFGSSSNYFKTNTNSAGESQSERLMVLENSVEVAQFINNQPEFLTLAEDFWKELANLPAFYEYNAYRKLIDRFGTHFFHSGSLGGLYKALLHIGTDDMKAKALSMSDMHRCVSSSLNILFMIEKISIECNKLESLLRQSSGDSNKKIKLNLVVEGGSAAAIQALYSLDFGDPAGNSEQYSSWARSVIDYPRVIKQKIKPLYELVKEVPCASVKRHYLKQAIEEYMSESDPCRCHPCQNGGQPVIVETQCLCVCKPDTFGVACELGTLVKDQPGVIDGGWSCWSSWSSCAGGRKSRSRSCNNPNPSGGGRSCIGEATENRQCEDEELQHFRSIEPHCFDMSGLGTESCPPPPPLENGYVQDTDSSYPVGKSIIYTCNDGYAIVGNSVATCGEGFQWIIGQMECQKTACILPVLEGGMRRDPAKRWYEIGEKVRLSCPGGMQLEGQSHLLCQPSLKWSPDIDNIRCRRRVPSVNQPSLSPREPVEPECQPWEKVQQTSCVCKFPRECGPSLDVCATSARTKRATWLTVCQLHALECVGRLYTLVSKENCITANAAERPCGSCHLWETCDDSTNKCTCRQDGACSSDGISICVQLDGSAAQQTMTECEAGLLRCRGSHFTIVSIRPCAAQRS